MDLTIHVGGEMKRYHVRMSSLTGQGEADCYVFATSVEHAKEAAIDKMRDKWLRHQDKITEWEVIGDVVEN